MDSLGQLSDHTGDVAPSATSPADVRGDALYVSAIAHRLIAGHRDNIKVLDLQGRLVLINESACRALGVDQASALLGQDWTHLWAPKERECAASALERARRGETARFEALRSVGERPPVWWDVTVSLLPASDALPAHLLVVSRDISEQKRIQSEYLKSEERLGLAVDAAELGTFYCPMPMGRIVWNAKCKEHFWLAPDAEVDFDLFYARLHPDDREAAREAVNAAVYRGENYDIEYRTVAPDGRFRWLRAIGRGYRDDNGEPTRFDGVTMDISQRKRVEQEREYLLESERSARAEAERASRMKDDFLAMLSHELRTPLNAITGWAQILAMGAQGELREGLETIERNARAQNAIINDMLDMSRVISGKLQLVHEQLDVARLLTECIEALRPSAHDKALRIETDFDQTACWVSGDATRLKQVFWNLVSNAIKFTPPGGRVQVRTVTHSATAEITVEDSGDGIPRSALPFIFDRFRQADGSTTRRYGGLGLGLSIAKQIVELHGGRIVAESEGLGHGACFRVVLPRDLTAFEYELGLVARPSEPAEAIGSEVSPTTLLEGLDVLVVDDEADARAVLKRMLEDSGARVRLAASVAEALSQFDTAPPHVLLSDISMPGEDGYALIRQIRSRTAAAGGMVPAIAVTAYVRDLDRAKALLEGYQGHVAKPVERVRLIPIVAAIAGRSVRHVG